MYTTIRADSRLLVTIEPWNLYMAVTVLESFISIPSTIAASTSIVYARCSFDFSI